jgi:ATP-dependent DNA helicase RecG
LAWSNARRFTSKAAMPHRNVLVMTATPIPRTLAMTLYGDLDVSVIDELPPGRKPIQTLHRYDSDRLAVWGFIKKQIAAGRQVYIVYPLIEESAKLDLKNLIDGYESICRDFPRPQYQASIVHGKMNAADKEFEMQRFIRGETQIMVATSVIEVGVDVPNASVYGHRKRRTFRSGTAAPAARSCGKRRRPILLRADELPKAEQRCANKASHHGEINDGFRIAEADLQLRAPATCRNPAKRHPRSEDRKPGPMTSPFCCRREMRNCYS